MGKIKAGVRVTFKRNNQGNASASQNTENHSDNHTENHTENYTGLSRIQRVVLMKLKENPAYSRRELADVIENASLGGVISALSRLQELQIISRVGPDKGGHWEIIKKGE